VNGEHIAPACRRQAQSGANRKESEEHFFGTVETVPLRKELFAHQSGANRRKNESVRFMTELKLDPPKTQYFACKDARSGRFRIMRRGDGDGLNSEQQIPHTATLRPDSE
jgi:hypothetical protein